MFANISIPKPPLTLNDITFPNKSVLPSISEKTYARLPEPVTQNLGDEKQSLIDKEPWRKASIPDADDMRRDWSRVNRKIAHVYPEVILPSWRRVRV